MELKNSNRSLKPLLKWVGGKRRLLPKILQHLPETMRSYYEPFLGGGTVLFAILPEKAAVSDVNEELINFYKVVRDTPTQLISHLTSHRLDEGYYYEIRSWDRSTTFLSDRSPVERASRMLFINKTCFNGLWRVNPKGYVNVPYAHPKKLALPAKEHVMAVSSYLKKSVELRCCSFEDVIVDAGEDDFVYVDPPYIPVSKTESFTGYSKNGFTHQDHVSLAEECRAAVDRGANVLASNSSCDEVRDLWRGFAFEEVSVGRFIGGKGSKRKVINELLIYNEMMS